MKKCDKLNSQKMNPIRILSINRKASILKTFRSRHNHPVFDTSAHQFSNLLCREIDGIAAKYGTVTSFLIISKKKRPPFGRRLHYSRHEPQRILNLKSQYSMLISQYSHLTFSHLPFALSTEPMHRCHPKLIFLQV
jgi:hypothetical protein